MKICYVTESFYPEINGCAVQARLLSEKFADLGHNILIVTRRPSASFARNEIVSKCPVIRVGPGNHYGMLGRYLGMFTILMPLFIHRRKYEIVLISAPRILGATVVLFMKLLGKKCVVKPDSLGEMDGSYALKQLRQKSFLYFIANSYFRVRNLGLKRADAYIAISTPNYDEICGIGIDSKLVFRIPNCVDEDRFIPLNMSQRRTLRARQGLSEDAVIFAYTGRLTREKGLVSLLHAWKKITEKFENVHLLLIGTGKGLTLDCEGELIEFIQTNAMGKYVTFTGAVEDVTSYLCCADVFVLPSITEALSIALLEAQLCGIPAIATQVGGTPDVIIHDKNGLLVRPNNDDDLFNAAVELISNNEKRVRLGVSARKLGVEKFSANGVTKSYISLFEKLNCSPVEI